MIPYTEFNLKYNTEFPPALYADWVSYAEIKALVFPLNFRVMAAEFYLGYLLCMTSGDRQPSEVKNFEVKPEGYSVAYTDGNQPRCDNWLNRLRQLGIAAGVEIPELKKLVALGADRTERFMHDF